MNPDDYAAAVLGAVALLAVMVLLLVIGIAGVVLAALFYPRATLVGFALVCIGLAFYGLMREVRAYRRREQAFWERVP